MFTLVNAMSADPLEESVVDKLRSGMIGQFNCDVTGVG